MIKRFFLIATILFVSFSAAIAQTKEARFKEANDIYAAGDYLKASQIYESLLQGDHYNWEAYYNLGNCYYKLDKLSSAILNYNRALLLEPGNGDVRHNLELATTRTTNRIVAVPTFFLSRWAENIRDTFSSDTWAILSIVSLTALFSMIFLFIISRRSIIRKCTFSLSIFFLLSVIISISAAQSRKSLVNNFNGAIVMRNAVAVKSSPADNGTDLFVLNEGVEVKVISILGSWSEISIANGSKGWLSSDSIERIKPTE